MSEVIQGEILPDGPRILHQGKYRLYEKPDGTLRVQYQRDDSDTEDYFELPGAIIRLYNAMGDKSMSPAQMMVEATKLMMSMGK